MIAASYQDPRFTQSFFLIRNTLANAGDGSSRTFEELFLDQVHYPFDILFT